MPLLAFLQGFFSMLTYRCFFGDSPKPLSPVHGVVVVHPKDSEQDGEECLEIPAPISVHGPEGHYGDSEAADVLRKAAT